jgi:hypothetical protein
MVATNRHYDLKSEPCIDFISLNNLILFLIATFRQARLKVAIRNSIVPARRDGTFENMEVNNLKSVTHRK